MASPELGLRRTAARQQGFTLIEMIISLAVLVLVLVGVLALFDLASRISRNQVDIADMQQSERTGQYEIVRTLRMAGRGGLPLQTIPRIPPLPVGTQAYRLPTGNAVSVLNNAPADTFINPGATLADRKRVLLGTDVLTVRGSFSNPVWTAVEGSFTVNHAPGQTSGTVRLTRTVKPEVPIPQSLQTLKFAKDNGIPEALLLVSPSSDSVYQIVELDTGPATVVNSDAQGVTDVTVAFRYQNGTHTNSYFVLSGGEWNPALTDVGYVAILEEYQYYILDERETPNDQTTATHPRLARARLYPGTGTVAGNPAVAYRGLLSNWDIPIADNVTDLQVAFGVETGVGSAFEPDEGPDKATDEWLFNHLGDNAGALPWMTGRLFFVRVTTTAYSARRERTYDYYNDKDAPGTSVTVEDHIYTVPKFGTASATMPDRTYRRRTLRTLIDLRNLS
jgi:prepilin-type N-terminal cleavage/methylation domain-containing protein